MSNEQKTVFDPQTGQTYTIIPERWFDIVAAWVSIGYSLATIAFLGWLLLDTWREECPIPGWCKNPHNQNLAIFKLVVYTAIGGGIGAAVNNVRGFVHWHAELKAFGWRFVWKYLSLPPLGATLAVMVYAIIQGGLAVFSGGFTSGTTSSFTAWATGALAGYGSHQVFIWLDGKVGNLFKVDSQTGKVAVPDLGGQTRDEAEQTLKDGKLALGDASEEGTSDEQKIGKVIGQTPAAGTEAAPDSTVAITVGTASDS